QALVQDSPEQESRAERIAARADEVFAWKAELTRLMRAGRKDEAVARLKTREGKLRMDDLRRQMAAFLAEEERLDRERAQALEQSRRGLGWLLLAGGLAA